MKDTVWCVVSVLDVLVVDVDVLEEVQIEVEMEVEEQDSLVVKN